MGYFVDQLLNGLSLGCVYALIALGFAMVFGVLQILNFAHSEVFTAGAFGGYFALRLLAPLLPPVPAVCLALVAAALGTGLLAIAIERIAYRPLRHLPRSSALITAIGVSIFLQNFGIHAFSAHTRGYPRVDLAFSPKHLAAVVLLASYVSLDYIVFRSNAGVRLRAVAERPDIAELMGVDPTRSVQLAFFIGGAFAGIAGVVWGLVYGTVNPQMGFHPSLKAFIIAVVGTVGNLKGTFIVGVALGICEALLVGYLPSSLSGYRDMLVLVLLLAVLVWRPSGLFGARGIEKA